LIGLVEGFDYFHTGNQKAYATFEVNGHKETHSVRGRDFKLHLQHTFYSALDNAINSKALADAIGALEAKALFDGPERQVFVRVGHHEGQIYLDLGAEDWAAIVVGSDGWHRIAAPPIRFIRPRGMRRLPMPVRAAEALKDIAAIVNLAAPEDFKLLVGWLLGALRPWGPYPVLSFRSTHGSGKTTASKVVRALIDPHEVPMRTVPRDDQGSLAPGANDEQGDAELRSPHILIWRIEALRLNRACRQFNEAWWPKDSSFRSHS
jgi:hypothetical protein